MVESSSRFHRDGLTVPYVWDNMKRRELVALYLDGMDVEMLASLLELSAREVLRSSFRYFLG